MPLDTNMLLRDGVTAVVDDAELAVVSTTINAEGAKVLDVKGTGAKGMLAVMVCPSAPTAFADTLGVAIQASDYISTDYKTVASFPTLYALNRRLNVTAVTAFAEADIGKTLNGTTTTDDGVIRWYDTALETIGGIGDIVVSQVAADSDFDDEDEAVDATAGTGDGTMNKVSELTEYLSYGIYAVRFVTTKRYVRASLTVSGGAGWGLVLIGLTDHWDFPLAAQ